MFVHAAIVQLVERLLAMEKVAGSSPVCRSRKRMKKFYVASRVRDRDRASKLAAQLERRGMISVSRWLRRASLRKPISEDSKNARSIAIEAAESISEADVFILLSDAEGTGMYVELGIALAESLRRPLCIYTIGEFGANSVFTYHPNIQACSSEEELLSLFEASSFLA